MDSSHIGEYVAYLRKSNGRKPIPRQRALTAGHVRDLGGRITAEFTDADRTAFRKTGGAAPEREDFTRMLAVLRASPGLGVAAWHADRITRNPEDTEAIIQVCAAGRNPIETYSGGRYELWTATGRKRLRDDATAAAYEVDHGRERVLAGRLEVAQQGRWLGGKRPFGWELDPAPASDEGEPLVDEDGEPVKGILRLVPRESAAVAQAHREVLDGMTLGSIARSWNEAGILTSLGREWRATEVGRVLRRPRNAGLMEYQGEITGKASWPAIVKEETWRAVMAILNDPGRKTTPGPARRHLLTFLAECDVCDSPVLVTSTGRRPVYRCRKDTRGHVCRDVAYVDDLVTRLVIGRLSKTDAADLLKKDTSADLAALRREQVAVEALMREENELRKRRLLTPEEFAESRTEHLADLDRIKGRMAELAQADVLAPFIGRAAEAWKDATLDRRRAVIDALMTIRIMPTRKGRPAGWRPGEPYFDPDSVKITPRKQ